MTSGFQQQHPLNSYVSPRALPSPQHGARMSHLPKQPLKPADDKAAPVAPPKG